MAEKQKQFQASSEIALFLGIFAIIIVCFLLLVPKVASTLFPWKRQIVLQNFLEQVKSSQTIPPQAFWEFREFYSPGYYTFNRNGVSSVEITKAEENINIPFKITKADDVFLTFTSPHLHSIEALVKDNSLANVVSLKNILPTSTILSRPNEAVWKDGNSVYIVFLKPTSDMKIANGYFDYNGQDAALVQGKYWLDITKLDGK